jgi:hypothetical protein
VAMSPCKIRKGGHNCILQQAKSRPPQSHYLSNMEKPIHPPSMILAGHHCIGLQTSLPYLRLHYCSNLEPLPMCQYQRHFILHAWKEYRDDLNTARTRGRPKCIRQTYSHTTISFRSEWTSRSCKSTCLEGEDC